MSGPFSLQDLLPPDSPLTVVDVGARSFQNLDAAYAALLDSPYVRVVGFEPDEAECERLNAAGDDRFAYHPLFVGDGRPATFHETNDPMTGSLYEPNTDLLRRFQNMDERTRPLAAHEVETVRLDDIEGLPDVDLLKIDVQGSELRVFENAPRVLSEASVVHTEVEFLELYKGQPLFADVDAHLRAAGFQFHTFHELGGRCFKPLLRDGNPNLAINQRLWADAVYVRDFMQLDRLPPEKLIKLAVILNDVYQSFDLCLVVLEAAGRQSGAALTDDYLKRLQQAKPA